jgi:hypothetical protein
MGHVADHFNAPIGSDAPERFQNQEELLRKHGITSLVRASPFVEVDCWKFITYTRVPQLVSLGEINKCLLRRSSTIAGAARHRPFGGVLIEGADSGRIKRLSAGLRRAEHGQQMKGAAN